MNEEKKVFQIDDLINDFFVDLETGDENQVLENYIKDFPEFEIELLEAAAYQRTVSEIPEYEYSQQEEEKLTLRTNSIVQNILYKHRQTNSLIQLKSEKVDNTEDLAIVDLNEEIEKKGFTVKSFARATRLPEEVIEGFITREIRFGSIIRQAIKDVASLLGFSEVIVDNYLLLGANPQPTHMKAIESPQFTSQMEFLDLIKYAPADYTEEDKQYWLAQKPQEEEYIRK